MENRKMINIQARTVVRKARKVGHTLKRGNWTTCAVGFLSTQTLGYSYGSFNQIAERLGLPDPEEFGFKVIRAIERGFEDATKNGDSRPTHLGYQSNFGYIDNKKELAYLRRYFNVGRNIAKQAGLPFCSY
jgi:hypothetical protein